MTQSFSPPIMSDRVSFQSHPTTAATTTKDSVPAQPDPPLQCVKPDAVPEPSFMHSMAELMHDVMPQTSGTPKQEQPERVEWVSFQRTDLNDARYSRVLQPLVGEHVPLVIVLGLAKGFQIWALTPLGDCNLIYSDRQGPVQILRLLPYPEPMVDSVTASGVKSGCALSIVSLRTGKHLVTRRYEQPVLDLQATSRALIVAFSGKLSICDTFTFKEQILINGAFKFDDPALPSVCSLSNACIAYADSKLSPTYQSCGGVSSYQQEFTYTSQVISAAKNLGKSVTALGESVVTSLSSTSSAAGSGSRASPVSHQWPSIVTVLDLQRYTQRGSLDENTTVCVTDNRPSSDSNTTKIDNSGILAHFCAHIDEPIGRMCFGSTSQLLATSGFSGQHVHVFQIQSHPVHSSMAAVQHLYTLTRGHMPAKVQDLSFSPDARWLAVSTNHGTTHVFSITPYGGSVSMRTHGSGKLVNRESRFHKSAGLDALDHHTTTATSLGNVSSSSNPHLVNVGLQTGTGQTQTGSTTAVSSASPTGSHKGSPLTRELHPSVRIGHVSLARASANPRLPPYSQPTLLYAASKIHQQMLAPSTLSARASDIVPTSTSATGTVGSAASGSATGSRSRGSITDGPYQIRACFAAPCAHAMMVQQSAYTNQEHDSLYLMNTQGQLIEYTMDLRSQEGANKQYAAQQLFDLKLRPSAMWQLQRTRSTPDQSLPLSPSHTIVVASQLIKQALDQSPQSTAALNSQSASPPESSSGGKSNSRAKRKNMTAVKARPTKESQDDSTRPWVSQVEIVSYSGPHRRLWMGPQFTFRTYRDTPHTVADLVSPSDTNARTRTEPMSMPGRAVPVLIEATSGCFDKPYPGVTVETLQVCGSWSDNDYISCDEQEGRLRETIADAMRDALVVSHSVQSSTKNSSPRVPGGDDLPMEDARSEFSDSPDTRDGTDSLQFVTS